VIIVLAVIAAETALSRAPQSKTKNYWIYSLRLTHLILHRGVEKEVQCVAIERSGRRRTLRWHDDELNGADGRPGFAFAHNVVLANSLISEYTRGQWRRAGYAEISRHAVADSTRGR
jgi:hypothetical protein